LAIPRATPRRLPAIALLCFPLLVASPALADPSITIDAVSCDAGLACYDVGIAFDDGESLSVFVVVTFTGSFNQLQAYATIDVDEDGDAEDLDGLGGYDADRDSYFMTSYWGNPGSPVGGGVGSGEFSVLMGSGGGSLVSDSIRLAYLVLPIGESFAYNATVSRDEVNYDLVPEPAGNLLQLAAAATLALLARLRARSHR
jgi:hypothetical protein